MKNILLAMAGFIMLILGVIGIVVPILPTTPFVIVAAACFSSTPTLYSRIMKIPLISEYITNYETRKGIPRKTVVVSIAFLWIMLTITAIAAGTFWIIICLAIVGIAVTTHIIMVSKAQNVKNQNINKGEGKHDANCSYKKTR